MKYSTLAGAALVFCLTVMPAAGGLLTDADYAYLAAQNVHKNASPLRGLSPKERSRLGSAINDPRTENDPAARAAAVQDLLSEFESNQHWEKMNPGQLWDVPKRRASPRMESPN